MGGQIFLYPLSRPSGVRRAPHLRPANHPLFDGGRNPQLYGRGAGRAAVGRQLSALGSGAGARLAGLCALGERSSVGRRALSLRLYDHGAAIAGSGHGALHCGQIACDADRDLRRDPVGDMHGPDFRADTGDQQLCPPWPCPRRSAEPSPYGGLSAPGRLYRAARRQPAPDRYRHPSGHHHLSQLPCRARHDLYLGFHAPWACRLDRGGVGRIDAAGDAGRRRPLFRRCIRWDCSGYGRHGIGPHIGEPAVDIVDRPGDAPPCRSAPGAAGRREFARHAKRPDGCPSGLSLDFRSGFTASGTRCDRP